MRLAPSALFASLLLAPLAVAAPPAHPHLLQRPALTKTQIIFNYAGDLWTVDRTGGHANRLTVGVGIETSPIVSPDGQTIAFAGEYDGNVDVFTIPITGGVPKRVTYHPAADSPVAWTPDGSKIIFRSNRDAHSRYTQLYEVSPAGGAATLLPLPMAYQGTLSPDGKLLAYEPLALPFGFNYSSYVAWGNYHGGQAGTVNVTDMATLATVTIPHDKTSDFAPVWMNGKVYFLSNRKGATSIFAYDPASKVVTEAFSNSGPSDLHSLAAGPGGLVYDQLGEIYLFDPATRQSKLVPINVDSDLPEVREHIETVSDQIAHAGISSTGLRAVFEAHGEILTVPAKKGPTRDITNTPGVMERDPAWSPDGQSIAYFSDEAPAGSNQPGLYAMHIASQTSSAPVKKFPLAPEPAYYFSPAWSPDSKALTFYDNRLNLWMLDAVGGKLTRVGEPNVFSSIQHDYAWSPDSKWIAFTRVMSNGIHAVYLYSLASGQATQITDQMADLRYPCFDKNGKYLYLTASTNEAGESFGLDMTSDLLRANRSIYAVVLASDGASPLAPESDDEKTVAAAAERSRDMGDEPAKPDESAPNAAPATSPAGARRGGGAGAATPAAPTPTRIDLAGIQARIVALPLPARSYANLQNGRAGGFFFEERGEDGGATTLKRFSLENRRADTVAERVRFYQVSADGSKILISQGRAGAGDGEGGGGGRGAAPGYAIINAPAAGAGAGGARPAVTEGAGGAPAAAGGALNLADMQIRVNPAAEWQQMYHEVWRVERAYFYDPNFHGVNTVAEEKKYEPYVASIASRSDLNYIFAEMLSGFSVGHLRGNGGQIPEAKRVPGGLLGADYSVTGNRYCIAKLYSGGHWNPGMTGPLTQPGLNVKIGDCILAIGGQEVTSADDIQHFLEGTANHAVTVKIATGAAPREITVIPIASEAALRNTDWIEGNIEKVDKLSGGKLAYVYLPDTAQGGFTNFNRYYFAQQDKQGAIIDERFNSGGQVADYIIQAMQRQLMDYWSPRYGAIEHTPNAAIYGPKVMITNEFAGSGGDAMPYLFRQQKVGPLVGKRTWGGLVGIGAIPELMDGGTVTSPSFGQFSPQGEWDVENRGVEPDYPVEQDPKAVSEGHDPQLEKAVALALEDLAKHPVPEPHRPAYPNYHK